MNLRREVEYAWKYLSAMPWWLWRGVRRKPFEWVAVNADDGEVDYVEPWNKTVYMAVKPHYMGLLKKLPCGCSRRLGRMVLFNMDCPIHGITREGQDLWD